MNPEWRYSRRDFLTTSAKTATTLGASLWGCATTAGTLHASAQSRRLKASVSIDPSADSVAFDRMLFGQFIEHFHREVYGGIFEPGSPLSDRRGFREDVIEALRELRVPIVRWPGGCFVSAYHWTDGVGRNRQSTYCKAWRVEEPNTFGTEEFVMWCRAIGAEPYICTNGGTGTPEEASNWVEYCNLRVGKWARMRRGNGYPEPHGVKYWSIGNENYGSWEMGAKSAQEWAAFVRETAKMIRRVDPSVKLFAAATSKAEWTEPLLKQAGGYLDYLSIHGYWDRLSGKNEPSDYRTCMARSVEPEKLIDRAERLILASGVRKPVKIAVDEWNLRGWHHPSGNSPEAIKARDKNDINSTYTMADALFSAVFLNTCLRHADTVRMANMSPVVNARGPLFVHPAGIVRRTTFHVLKMYSDLLAANVVNAQTSSDALAHKGTSVPALDAVATCDADRRKFVLALINRHPTDELDCEILFGGKPLEGAWPATVLSGDSTEAFNDVGQPNRVVPKQGDMRCAAGIVRLPAHSVTLCEVARS